MESSLLDGQTSSGAQRARAILPAVVVSIALLTALLICASWWKTARTQPASLPYSPVFPSPAVVKSLLSSPSSVDVYICAGQSNMVGGVGNPPDELNTYNSPLLLQLGLWPGYDLKLLQATEPLQEAFTNNQTGNVGPCMSFAATLVNKTGRTSVLLPAAVQSTGFSTSTNIVCDDVSGTEEPIIGNWKPVNSSVPDASSYLYQRLVSRASFLKQLGFRMAGMLWLQGEADCGGGSRLFWGPPPGSPPQSTAEHTHDVVALFQSIRAALDSPMLPVVLLQMAPRYAMNRGPNATGIQDSIDLLPFVLPYTATAWSIDPLTGELLSPAPDEVHYNASMQRVLGKLGAVAFDAALNNHDGSVPGPLLPSPVPNTNNALQWAPDPQADGYVLYVHQLDSTVTVEVKPTAISPSSTSPVQLVSCTFDVSANASSWTAAVQAFNQYGKGPLSAAVSFHVRPSRISGIAG